MTTYDIDRRPSPTLGLVLNQPAHEIPTRAWVRALNVRMRDGAVEKLAGSNNLPTVPEGICDESGVTFFHWFALEIGDSSAVASTAIDGTVTLIDRVRFLNGTLEGVIGTNRYLYRVTPSGGLAPLNATPFLATPDTPWDFDTWLNNAYFTNGYDPVQVWPGAASAVSALTATAGTIPRAQNIAEFQNHLYLSRLVESGIPSPFSIKNSHLNGPQSWDDTDPQSEASLEPVTAGNDPILRILRISNFLAIYKQWTIHLFQYIGLPLVNDLRKVADMGTVSGRSVVDISGRNQSSHAFIGQDNIYLFDSNGLTGIGDTIWTHFYSLINPDYEHTIYGFHDIKKHSVVWPFVSLASTQGDYDLALEYNYVEKAFSMRDWPFSATGYVPSLGDASDNWDDDDEPWDNDLTPWDNVADLRTLKLIAGNRYGGLFIVDDDKVSTLADNRVEAVLESGDYDFGLEDYLKKTGGMRINVTNLTGTPLELRVGWRNSLDASINWKGPYYYDGSSGRIDFRATGRWQRFEFRKRDGSMTLKEYSPLWTKCGRR